MFLALLHTIPPNISYLLQTIMKKTKSHVIITARQTLSTFEVSKTRRSYKESHTNRLSPLSQNDKDENLLRCITT